VENTERFMSKKFIASKSDIFPPGIFFIKRAEAHLRRYLFAHRLASAPAVLKRPQARGLSTD